MKMDEVTCSACEVGFRRVELTSEPGQGRVSLPGMRRVLEKFDGSAFIAYRLTIQPSTRGVRE